MSIKPASMIIGIGAAAPDKILTNHDLEKMVDTSDQWIKERTGIERRHILEEGKTNSDVAALAGKQAVENAGISVDALDCIIVATITPDSLIPCTACRVQAELGAGNAAAFDISAAWKGFSVNSYLNSFRKVFNPSLIWFHLLLVRPLFDSGLTITCVFRNINGSLFFSHGLFSKQRNTEDAS